MKKKSILSVLLFGISISLVGCAYNRTDAAITFSQKEFTVSEGGLLNISGHTTGLKNGYYEANIDRENRKLYIDKEGNFSIDSYIIDDKQQSFPIGIALTSGEIIVNSAQLDTSLFTKSLENRAYVSPEKVVGLFKRATLSVFDEQKISEETLPFKFREGISFNDGSGNKNNLIRVFSFKNHSDFNDAKNYFINLSKSVLEKSMFESETDSSQKIGLTNGFQNQKMKFEDPESQLKQHLLLYKLYPLYGSRLASDRDYKVIVVSENGIQDPQFEMYRRIIETLGNYYELKE